MCHVGLIKVGFLEIYSMSCFIGEEGGAEFIDKDKKSGGKDYGKCIKSKSP